MIELLTPPTLVDCPVAAILVSVAVLSPELEPDLHDRAGDC
jgi:hypothetical protein